MMVVVIWALYTSLYKVRIWFEKQNEYINNPSDLKYSKRECVPLYCAISKEVSILSPEKLMYSSISNSIGETSLVSK